MLPAYNEEPNIGAAIQRVTSTAERLFEEHEVIIVDDGSTDRTAELVKAAASTDPRVRLVRHPDNLGYGLSLRDGFLAARLDFVFFTDADLQFDIDELERLLPYAETVDVVSGYREARKDPLARKVAAFGWNLLVRLLFYVPVRDIDCAFKLFRRSALQAVDLESAGNMINTELLVKLGRAGASVVEVPVTHYRRPAGNAKGVNARVIVTAVRELVGMRRKLRELDATTLQKV